ncbi:MAG: hypothetical protein WCG87_12110 [Bacteroidota bacterium]
MRKRLTVIVLILYMSGTPATYAQSTDVTDLFYRLRTKIERVKDYVADVRMTIDVSFMRIPPLNGTLYFKAPGKLKLERKGGIAILPKKSIDLTLNKMIPLGNVTVINAGTDTINGKIVQVVKIVPDNDQTGIVLTKVWIDATQLLALRTETTSRDNGTMKMNLEYGKYADMCLPDKVVFIIDVKDYKLPKGVTMDYDAGADIAATNTPKPPIKKGKIQVNYLKYQVNTGLSDEVFIEKR